MAEEKTDEVVEEIIEEGAPAEETTEEPASEESSTSDKETPAEEKGETVPINRFKEVYRREKETAKELSDLRKDKAEPKTEAQTKEVEAKSYLKGLLKEVRDEEKVQQDGIDSQEQRDHEEKVEETLEANPDVKRSDFLKFMEDKSSEYELTSVKGAMKVFKDLQSTSKETAEQTKKEEARKPSHPKSEGAAVDSAAPTDDSKKSFAEITQEAIKSADVK